MSIEQNSKEVNPKGFFKFIEFTLELYGWLRIVASPFIIGIILGAFIYFPQPSQGRLVLGSLVAALGLFIGIVWASKHWKGKGTLFFLSRTQTTPELDSKKESEQELK